MRIAKPISMLGVLVCGLAGWPAGAEAERWIVQYRNHSGKERGARAAQRAKRVFRLIPAIVVDDADLARVKGDPDVVSIEPDVEVHALVQDPAWGLSMVHAPEVWPITRGAGVKVAILDTGIALQHPDLPAPVAVFEVEDLPDIGSTEVAADDNGHGTHVAGILAALDNDVGVVGVAPEASLLVAKVLGYDGHGSASGVIAGIEWAVDNGAQVINMSLGAAHDYQEGTIAMGNACVAAAEAGVVLVAAAGNDGSDVRHYPAAFEPVIAVGSVNQDGTKTDFSNYGSWVDIYAPGKDILSTYNNPLYAR
jgi:subtilisin family serine protease